jgi:hypothetical protein
MAPQEIDGPHNLFPAASFSARDRRSRIQVLYG